MDKKQEDPKYKAYLADSKKRLLDIIERKMKTTFIGALSEVERKFGVLWGDKNYGGVISPDKVAKITKETWEEVWAEARDRILTNGNNQFKAILNEFEQYDVHWNRYRITFYNTDQS